MTMQCETFIVLMDDYITLGNIGIIERAEIRTHMELCEECRAAYVQRRMDLVDILDKDEQE